MLGDHRKLLGADGGGSLWAGGASVELGLSLLVLGRFGANGASTPLCMGSLLLLKLVITVVLLVKAPILRDV